MSALLLKRVQQSKKQDADQKERQRPPQERVALSKIRSEAKEHGATLHSDGEGGLQPSLVLGVMRRDKWRCVRCGGKSDLTVHHIGGIVDSAKANRMGHKNKPANLETLCSADHNDLHDEARANHEDSSQVLPKGDVGTDRDHGDKPVAEA